MVNGRDEQRERCGGCCVGLVYGVALPCDAIACFAVCFVVLPLAADCLMRHSSAYSFSLRLTISSTHTGTYGGMQPLETGQSLYRPICLPMAIARLRCLA